MTDPRKEYRRMIRLRWTEEGRCDNCGGTITTPQRKKCDKCLDRQLEATRRNRGLWPSQDKNRYLQRKSEGLCVDCGKPSAARSLCPGCLLTEKQRAIRTKNVVMQKYGGSCVCCGESGIAFLTIDHVLGDGNEKRKTGEHAGGGRFYKKLKKLPIDPTLRILCWNCNMARRMTGVCPHVDDSYFSEAITRGLYSRRKTIEQTKPRKSRLKDLLL